MDAHCLIEAVVFKFFTSLQALTYYGIYFILVCVCICIKLGVPSVDDLIDVYTVNIFNNLMLASKEITPKSALLFIYSLQICHRSIFSFFSFFFLPWIVVL